MRLEVFAGLTETVLNAKQPDEIKAHHGKRKRSNWFILDAHEKKYLKHGESSEDHNSSKRKSATMSKETAAAAASATASATETTTTPNPTDSEEEDVKKVHQPKSDMEPMRGGDHVSGKKEHQQPSVIKPQKWKEREKKLFFDALDKHGEFLSVV